MIDGFNRNDFAPDVKAIHADTCEPMTVEELRNRLKHIAMLCWGLSSDLATEMSECKRVRKENKKLREQIILLGGRIPSTRGGNRRGKSNKGGETSEGT